MAAEEAEFQLRGNAAERYEQAISLFMFPWSAHLVDQAGLAPGAVGRDHPVTVPMHTWLAKATQI